MNPNLRKFLHFQASDTKGEKDNENSSLRSSHRDPTRGDTKNVQDKIFDYQGAGKTKATILKRKWNKNTSEMGGSAYTVYHD